MPNPGGVRSTSWPLALLSTAWVREQWGPGTYRVQWQNDSKGVLGFGRPFVLDPGEEAEEETEELPDGPLTEADRLRRRLQAEAQASVASMFDMARELAGMRAGSAAPVPAGDSEELRRMRDREAELREELASLKRRDEVRTEIERVERVHREELAERDRRMVALERRVHEAELVTDDAPDGPALDPSEPIMGQVVAAVIGAALKNPEAILAAITEFASRVSNARKAVDVTAQSQAAAAQSAPAPAPAPAPRVEVEGPTMHKAPATWAAPAEEVKEARPARVVHVVEVAKKKNPPPPPIVEATGEAAGE